MDVIFLYLSASLLYVQCLDVGIWTLEMQVDSPVLSSATGKNLAIVFLLGPRYPMSLLAVRG